MPITSDLVIRELESDLWGVREDLRYQGQGEPPSVSIGTPPTFAEPATKWVGLRASARVSVGAIKQGNYSYDEGLRL